MCSGRTLPLAALAALGLAARASAQDAVAVRRHADRLVGAYERAQALTARQDTALGQRVPLDTIRAGALRVLAVPSITVRAQGAADTAWSLLNGTFGRAANVIGQTTLVVQVFGQTEGDVHAIPPAVDVSAPEGADAAVIARRLVTQAAYLVTARQDPVLRDWISGMLIPLPYRDDRFDLVYIDLVTSPFSRAQACFVGDLAACRSALGLSSGADPLLDLYDASDRRRIAAEYTRFARPADRGAFTRCAEGGPDSGCIAALYTLLPFVLSSNPPVRGRLSLVALALELGGPGAYDRLIATPRRPLADRLAAASRLPADSLVALWRARAIAARPQSPAIQPRVLWAGVFWGALLGVLALRSTRWR